MKIREAASIGGLFLSEWCSAWCPAAPFPQIQSTALFVGSDNAALLCITEKAGSRSLKGENKCESSSLRRRTPH
jgi:hypothetical protein